MAGKNASISKILAALGNATRLDMVKRLALAETFAGKSISELAEGTGLTRQAITKHLEALADAGLLIRRKPGRATWYELNAEPIRSVIEALTAISQQRDRSEERLKAIKAKFQR